MSPDNPRTPDMFKNGAEIDISTEHVDPIDTTPGHTEPRTEA